MTVDNHTVQIVMPTMGDSVAEGTVLEWRKQEGDHPFPQHEILELVATYPRLHGERVITQALDLDLAPSQDPPRRPGER